MKNVFLESSEFSVLQLSPYLLILSVTEIKYFLCLYLFHLPYNNHSFCYFQKNNILKEFENVPRTFAFWNREPQQQSPACRARVYNSYIHSVLLSGFKMDPKICFKTLPKVCIFDVLYLMIVTFELSLLQASINLQRRFEIHMQLITTNYLTFYPESLQMCKWCVYFFSGFFFNKFLKQLFCFNTIFFGRKKLGTEAGDSPWTIRRLLDLFPVRKKLVVPLRIHRSNQLKDKYLWDGSRC